MSKKTMKLALEALEKLNNTNSHWWQEVDENVIVQLSNAESALRETLTSVPDWASEAIEQPAQRCPLCNYQHGHAIGCKNNPVDIALNKMAENARELGLDYEPAQQEPVAWGIIASNTGRICQVELDADEIQGHNPKYIVPLYTSHQHSAHGSG